jgi:TPR repeat protein/spermidine synthase
MLEDAKHGPRLGPLSALFFLSGTSGLIYQVVWFRMLARAFGVTVYAVTTVLVVFMAGLALGSLAAGTLANGGSRLRTYGKLELLVGVTGAIASQAMLLLPGLFHGLLSASAQQGAIGTVARVVVSCLVLLPPTVLMGATLPVLSGHVTEGSGSLGKRAGLLYGVNTLGAVVGVLATGFVLIAELGEKGTVLVAVGFNLAIGLASLGLASRERHELAPLPRGHDHEATVPVRTASSRRILLVAFASGACALSFEVIWFRVLAVLLGNSVYGFSCMLGAYLIGIGAGSVAMSQRADTLRRPTTVFGLLELGIGILGMLSLQAFLALGLRNADPRYVYGLIWDGSDFVSLALNSLFIVLPATLLYGAIFPIATRLVGAAAPGAEGARASEDAPRIGAEVAVGRLYAFNTLGNITGSLLTGFVLIPTLGTRTTFLGVALVSMMIGGYLILLAREREELGGGRRSSRALWTALAVAGAGAFVVIAKGKDPFVQVLLRRAGPSAGTLVAHEEDRGATVSLFEDAAARRTLYINGLYVSNTSPGVGEQMVNFPLAFDASPGPKKVLAIGLGVGESLRYSIDVGHEITVVELQRSVVDLFRRFNPDHAKYLDNPRAKIVLADGRNFLLNDDEKYDLILVDGSPPVYASGMVNLYSLEFMKLARDHLTADGLFVVWFPVVCFESDFWMVVRNFSEGFPALAIYSPPSTSNALLMGASGPSGKFALGIEEMAARLARYRVDPTLTAANLSEGMFLSEGDLRRRAAVYPSVTDDHPYTEFPLMHFMRGEPYHADNRFLYPERFPGGTHRCDKLDGRDCAAQCDAGQLDSCFFLGLMYMSGRGAPRDDSWAAAAFQRACDGGLHDACGNLGYLLQHGRGVPADDSLAASMFRKACDGGGLSACNALGIAYETGRGVARDDARALALIGHACRGGNAGGCFDLGAMHEAGKGVSASVSQAAALYEQSCDQGLPAGCARLATILASGQAISDRVHANSVLKRACDRGCQQACETAAGVP